MSYKKEEVLERIKSESSMHGKFELAIKFFEGALKYFKSNRNRRLEKINAEDLLVIFEELKSFLRDERLPKVKKEMEDEIYRMLPQKREMFTKYYFDNIKLAEAIILVLSSTQKRVYKVCLESTFDRFIKVIKFGEEKKREHKTVYYCEYDDYDDSADRAEREYNLHMDWQEGEIDDGEYYRRLYR